MCLVFGARVCCVHTKFCYVTRNSIQTHDLWYAPVMYKLYICMCAHMYVACVVCAPICPVLRTTICGCMISLVPILYCATAYVCTFVCVHLCNHICVHISVYICVYTKFSYMTRNNMWTRHVFFCTVLYCIVRRCMCTFVCAPSFPV